jgi:hypothetical protein
LVRPRKRWLEEEEEEEEEMIISLSAD